MKRETILLGAVAALACVAPGAAQQTVGGTGPLLGGAVGISETREPGAELSRVAPSVQVHAGWAVTPHVSLLLESALNGKGGRQPESYATNIDPAAIIAPPRSELVETWSLLASVQLSTASGTYVRPGVGMADHTFGTWTPAYLPTFAPGGAYYIGRTEHEWGPAAGVALGQDLSRLTPLPVGVEAVALWSGGEDSTGSRWSFGLQLMHDIHF
jgi:hypothetical protein